MPLPLAFVGPVLKGLKTFLTPKNLKILGILLLVGAVLAATFVAGMKLGNLRTAAAWQVKLDAKEAERKKFEDEVIRLQGEALTQKSEAEKALAQALSDLDTERARSKEERRKLLEKYLADRKRSVTTQGTVASVPASYPPCFHPDNISVINGLLEKSNATGFFAAPTAP